MCFAFGLILEQCQRGSPFQKDRPHSCEKDEVSEAALSYELRSHLGAAARRGSAPVIDTHMAKHIAQLHALIKSQRSISPNPTVPEDQFEICATEHHSEADDGFPCMSDPSLLQVSPVPQSESNRLKDTSTKPSSEDTLENLALPVPSGRRHSDLSGLLSLTSHHNHHFTMHRGHVCRACLYLLHLRSKEGNYSRPSGVMPHCPFDLRHHPSSGGAMANPGFGRHKGSSDCSDFSLLQRSLLNIISRKAIPCHTTSSQHPLLHFSAAQRLACSTGDDNLKSHLLSGNSFGDKEPLQDSDDRFCAREQQATSAVGLVGHNSRQMIRVSLMGTPPAYLISRRRGSVILHGGDLKSCLLSESCCVYSSPELTIFYFFKITCLLVLEDNGAIANRPRLPAD